MDPSALPSSATPAAAISRRHEVAQQMTAWRQKFPFEFVVMLGDNIYPPHAPDDFDTKFETPYRALLDQGVTFYAAIGNHDPETELTYAKFNMEGRRYYTFRRNERRLEGLTGRGRPILRPRQPVVRSVTARVASRRARAFGNRLEDLLFSSSALHIRALHALPRVSCGSPWNRS